MSEENPHPRDEQSSPKQAAAPEASVAAGAASRTEKAPELSRWLWALPPALTVLLAVGVATWGVDFGAAAIAALGAWIVGVIAREGSPRRGPAWAIAWGVAAGVLVWLLCTQQGALIFRSPRSGSESHSSLPAPTQNASAISCNAEVEQNPSGASAVTVSGNIARLPRGAKVSTIATSDGRVLAMEDSYPDGNGVATIHLSFASAPSQSAQIRSEVRIGARIVQTCGW